MQRATARATQASLRSTHRSAKKYYTHWMQRFARAATLQNARHMLAQAGALKAEAIRLATRGAGL